jgi:hypothetical protein
VRKALPPRRDPFRIDVSASQTFADARHEWQAPEPARSTSEELCWTPLAIRAQARNHGVKQQ